MWNRAICGDLERSLSRFQIVAIAFHLTLASVLLLASSEARAVDVHISPRFWYAITNLDVQQVRNILTTDIELISSFDQAGIPLVGLTVLVEGKLDVIASFFWGTNKADFIFGTRAPDGLGSELVLRSRGEIESNRYDAEILLRWRPKDRPISLFTGLRYYHINYNVNADSTEAIPRFNVFPVPPFPDEINDLAPFPEQKYKIHLFLWEIGVGMHAPITSDSRHRLIAGGLIGLGYSTTTVRRKAAPLFINNPPAAEYPSFKEDNDAFALGWDVNIGYQWQFLPKLNFVGRYRAFGKSSPATNKHQMSFIIDHGPEIGIGYSF